MDKSVAVKPTNSLREVLACLQQNDHGVCVVMDESNVVLGLITDGDCRRALLKNLTLDAPASQVMKTDFLAVDPSFSVDQIRLLMRTNDIRQVPVVDEQRRLIRIVSERSLLSIGARPNSAVVLAGGKGTRLGGLTRHRPKPMLPVSGKPMLEHIIQQLVEARFTTIYLSVNYLAHVIQEYFGDGSRWGCSIEYVAETMELGTAGSLLLIKDRLSGPFIVTNGDVITTVDFGAFLDFHVASKHDMTLGVRSYTMQIPYGVVTMGNDGLVTSIAEKPFSTSPVNAGIYVVDAALLDYIEPGRAFPMTELIQAALTQGNRIGAFMIHEVWDDIGVPAEFIKAQALLEDEEDE